jgi:hypothetical protein
MYNSFTMDQQLRKLQITSNYLSITDYTGKPESAIHILNLIPGKMNSKSQAWKNQKYNILTLNK